ncbi:helix-turn-helix domain-containing protein [Brevundimonas terrae]|jgi:transcriptional regulator with XRE-family HTH domain|uniref:helix-turn-helix domain-containing protein n=1 Tax=Brevundimonas terrae TaxID=363631 RepID=UPI00142216FC|nr:helix-turn-helix transcriptional regulator [Brevundimonas terrae]NIJ25884.1 transcriptional regulator with XRE-family HTH domain [Brevundimonas terrae]
MDIRVVIGRNVRRFRVAKGLTQEELSALCDFDQRYISQVETGQRNLTVLSLYELAQALGTTPVALITPDGEATD